MTTTACDNACGRPLDLAERHVTVVRHVERVDHRGTTTVADADVVGRFHERCAPTTEELTVAVLGDQSVRSGA